MFSVAVITYNQEKYISQTLDSILNQEHDYKYEIVIGEDCSTDNTKKIIEEYFEKYPDIIKPLYNNPNKGLINNYFNVINHCQGKYIMECAGDDYWLPGKVKAQIEFMESNLDVGMCYGKARIWNEKRQKFEKKKFGTDRKDFEFLLINGNDIPALSVCFRNELAQQYIAEIKPQEKNWLMEDYPMWLWFYHKSCVKFFNEVVSVYRVLENSASHSFDLEKRKVFFESTIEIQEYFSVLCKNISFNAIHASFSFYFHLFRKYDKSYKKEIDFYFSLLEKKNIMDYIKLIYTKITW